MDIKRGRPVGTKTTGNTKASVSLSAPVTTLAELYKIIEDNSFNMSALFTDFLNGFVEANRDKKTLDLEKALKNYEKKLLTGKPKTKLKKTSSAFKKNKVIVNMTIDPKLAHLLREDKVFNKYNVSALVNAILWNIYNQETEGL